MSEALDVVKKAAVWGGPALAGVAVYAAVASSVTVPGFLLVVGAGVGLSWAGKLVWDKWLKNRV